MGGRGQEPVTPERARQIADALSWSRILIAVPLTVLAWLDLRWWFLAIYIAAAITDSLDGAFARRATPSTRGAEFDGRADIVFTLMTLVWLWMLVPGFYGNYGLPYIPALLLLQAYLVALRILRPQTVVPHLDFSRIAFTLFCCLLPVLLVVGDVAWFVELTLVVTIVAKSWLALRVSGNASEPGPTGT